MNIANTMNHRNSLIHDLSFVNRLSTYVRNFKQKAPYLWNFSCPICGDSEKHKNKSRFYVYESDTSLVTKCHNCGWSSSFSYFLKYQYPALHKEYVLEMFRDDTPKKETVKTKIVRKKPRPIKNTHILEPILSLPEDHEAVSYLLGRKIPRHHWKLMD